MNERRKIWQKVIHWQYLRCISGSWARECFIFKSRSYPGPACRDKLSSTFMLGKGSMLPPMCKTWKFYFFAVSIDTYNRNHIKRFLLWDYISSSVSIYIFLVNKSKDVSHRTQIRLPTNNINQELSICKHQNPLITQMQTITGSNYFYAKQQLF